MSDVTETLLPQSVIDRLADKTVSVGVEELSEQLKLFEEMIWKQILICQNDALDAAAKIAEQISNPKLIAAGIRSLKHEI